MHTISFAPKSKMLEYFSHKIVGFFIYAYIVIVNGFSSLVVLTSYCYIEKIN